MKALRTFTALLALGALVGLASCRTMQGLGEDTSKLGNKITNKAVEEEYDD